MSAIHDAAAAVLRRLPPEPAHNAALWSLSHGLGPKVSTAADPILSTTVWGRSFPNPLGIAAGFDKNARAIAGLLRLGVGFAEVGGVTPLPQRGNPRPRLFRLPADAAVINRMGFNNAGVAAVAARLGGPRNDPRAVGANLAANTDSDDPAADFATLVRELAPLADFLTIDISCPNTANGRIFLSLGPLTELLARLQSVRANVTPAGETPTPMLVKLAPDIDDGTLQGIVSTAMAAKIDGIIVCNTTTARPTDLQNRYRAEIGGLSGRPLFEPSTALLRRAYILTGGTVPLIGVGGVASGADAYAKIRAGASLVQLYTALVYTGPSLIPRIIRELAACLQRDGFAKVADAVGADIRSQ